MNTLLKILKSIAQFLGFSYIEKYITQKGFISSVLFIILVNLIPIAGVYLLKWNQYDIIFLYWVEGIVIGIFTAVKIGMAKNVGQTSPPSYDNSIDLQGADTMPRVLLIPFFLMHYGIFTFVHGMFIFRLFLPKSTFFINKDFKPLLIFFVATIISHGVSFFVNFIKKKEYEKKTSMEYMASPYPRIIVMHIVIMLGALFFGHVIVLFVILKTIFDIFLHLGSHAKIAEKSLINSPETPQISSHTP